MQSFKRAFKNSLPVMTGYIVLGIGYGILMNAKGYNALWSLIAGLIIYSGTMQFVAIDLFAGASYGAVAMTSLMVSARHLFYGISMADGYKNVHGLKKFYMIYALTDETYALVCNNAEDENYCFWVSLLDQFYWVLGGFLGGLLGQIIPFNSKGIDFALTALFITICVEQWLNSENHYPALTGFLASVVCLLIFGSENFLIPSMILITAMLFLMREKSKNHV